MQALKHWREECAQVPGATGGGVRWGWMGGSGDGVDAGRPRGGARVWWMNAHSWPGELHRHQILRVEKFFHPQMIAFPKFTRYKGNIAQTVPSW